MAVSLANVSISLNEFQRLSKGEFNAGEVRLSDEHNLKKMNNHVNTRWFSNNETISHAEVLTIKQALVNALSANGVGGEGLDSVRKELGLAAKGSVDTGLVGRSIKPLTRQQIREILDKHADTINAFNTANHGDVHISTTRELYGADKMPDNSLKEQKRINDALADPTRALSKNESLLCLSRIIANDIEFDTDAGTREAILAKAKEQLKKLKTLDAAGHDENAKVSFECAMDHGPRVTISTGMTKTAMIQRLEDVIARLTKPVWPSAGEREARNAFKAIAGNTADETRTARNDYLEGLRTQNDGDVRARAIGVMLLSEAGITDWDTLSVVNRLSKDDAIALAKRLVALAPNANAAALRNDADLQTLFAKEAVKVGGGARVCIPAASPVQFNTAAGALMYTDYVFPEFRSIIDEAIDEARQIYGTQAVPEGVRPNTVLSSGVVSNAFPNSDDPSIVRTTPDSFRAYIRRAAHNNAARKLLEAHAPEAVRESLGNPVLMLERHHPQLIERLRNANSAQEATAAANACIEPMVKLASVIRACNAAKANLEAKMLQKLADAAHMDVAEVSKNFGNACFSSQVKALADKIVSGRVDVVGEEAIKAAFDQLVEDFVKRRADIMKEIDGMDVPGMAKFQMKMLVLSGVDVKYVDMDVIKDAVSTISVDELYNTLSKPGVTDDEAFGAFVNVNANINANLQPVFGMVKDIAPDDKRSSENLVVIALAHKCDGLFDRLVDFFDKPSVKDAKYYGVPEVATGAPAVKFMEVFDNAALDYIIRNHVEA